MRTSVCRSLVSVSWRNIHKFYWHIFGLRAQVIMKKKKFSNNNLNLVPANSVWLINQLILWKFSLELLKFLAPTQILDMLNTFYLTIADFYLQDFTNFPAVFLRCRSLLLWLSFASSLLFWIFSLFGLMYRWKKYSDRWDRNIHCYHHRMQYYTSTRF